MPQGSPMDDRSTRSPNHGDGAPSIFSRIPTRNNRTDIEMQIQEERRKLEIERNRLIGVMFGDEQKFVSRLAAYFEVLEGVLRRSRHRILPLLNVTGHPQDVPLDEVLHLVTDVAIIIRDDRDDARTVQSLFQALLRQYDITETSVSQATRNLCWQSIFDILCWLTALVDPGAMDIEMTAPVLTLPAILEGRRPFTSLLKSYGNVLPEIAEAKPESQIYASRLNYWTLKTIGKVQIQWTNCLSAHLYFDQSRRKLYLFRLPGFCAANLDCDKTESLFQSILSGYYYEERSQESQLAQYQREILLSYRLIFGQSKASRKLFANREKRQAATSDKLCTIDPFLSLLCSQRKMKGKALPPTLWPEACRDLDNSLLEQDVYDTSLDFRLLGDRLLALQAFNDRQHPSRIRDLWRDRRDPLQWYTFWLVLVVGGLSLVFSILQCALSAAQLAQNASSQ